MTIRDNVYWVVQKRTKFFGTWKPVELWSTKARAVEREAELGGGVNFKVDRVELQG